MVTIYITGLIIDFQRVKSPNFLTLLFLVVLRLRFFNQSFHSLIESTVYLQRLLVGRGSLLWLVRLLCLFRHF